MPRSTRTAAAAAVAAIALILPLAGCGEKDEPETTGPVVAQSTSPIDGSTTTTTPTKSDEELASNAARAFLVSTDAATVCDEGITPELLKQAYGDRDGCLAARKPQSLAQSAEIGKVDVTRTTGLVTARASGGVFGNGEMVKVTVVGDAAGVWRVSKVASGATP